MNLERIVTMALRMAMRKLMNRGVAAGIDALARRGGPGAEDAAAPPAEQSSGASKMARKAGRESAKRARQTLRFVRRLGR